MQKTNWDEIQEAQDFEKPVPGGYIAKITSVKEVEDKEYWWVEWDFSEGQFKDYYHELFASKDFWGGKLIRSYKPKAMPFFKAFKTALEESNRGFKFDETNPGCIVGKVMGIVLAEEEYIGNDGKMKIRTYVDKTHSVRAIQAGDFKVPELKKLAGSAAAASASAGNQFAELPENEEELPF
jgi:hypothetical protein